MNDSIMQSQIPRQKKDFIYHLGNVMEQLQSAYLHRMPEQGPAAFKTIWQGVLLQKSDADTIAKKSRFLGKTEIMDLILVACAYCAHAGREYHEDHQEIAWTYLVEAAYYSGAALYAKALETAWPEIEQATVQMAVAGTKSKGGKTKNAGWKRVEDEAVRLVKILGEQGQRWDTERKMAVSIRPELWPFALHEVPGFSEKRYVQTISCRLKLRLADIGIYLNKRRASS